MRPTTANTAAARERAARVAKALVRRLVEDACAGNDYAALDALLASRTAAERITGLLRLVRSAVPDARWIVEEQVAEGDTVVTRLRVEGTQRGPLLGIAPTDRAASLSGVLICRVAGGRIVSGWAQADLLGLLAQLGVMPELDIHQAIAVARMAQLGRAAIDCPGAPRGGDNPRDAEDSPGGWEERNEVHE